MISLNRKSFLIAAMCLLVCLLFTACSDLSGGNESSTAPDAGSGVAPGSYLFHISSFPYDSRGYEIYVQFKNSTGTKLNEVKLGSVASVEDSYAVDLTADYSAPSGTSISSMTIALRQNHLDRYTLNISELNQTGEYTVDRYWKADYNYSAPYAIHRNYFETPVFETPIITDFSDKPFIIYKLTNAAYTTFRLTFTTRENVYVYVTPDINKLLNPSTVYSISTYQPTYEFSTGTSDTYYVMFQASAYGQNPSLNVKIGNVTAGRANCIRVTRALLTTDGTVFLTGWTDTETRDSSLYTLDSETRIRTTRAEFTDEEGNPETIKKMVQDTDDTLLIAAGQKLYKYKISDGTKTVFATFDYKVIEFATFNESLIAFTECQTNGHAKLYFVSDSGEKTEIKEGKSLSGPAVTTSSPIKGTGYMQIPNTDLIIWQSSSSPLDFHYFRISEENNFFITSDSQYHGDYGFLSPLFLYSTNPIKVGSGDGDVFTVDQSQRDGNDYLITGWLSISESDKFNMNIDWWIVDSNYAYYAEDDIQPGCTIQVANVSDPHTVIDTITYPNEEICGTAEIDGKAYLITYSSVSTEYYPSYYTEQIFVHELGN